MVCTMLNQTKATEPLKVNTSDLDEALMAGIHCLSNITNPDDRHIPYFTCHLAENVRMGFHHRFSVGNVVGRGLFAMLRAEQALEGKLAVDPEVIDRYRNLLLESYRYIGVSPATPAARGEPFNQIWVTNHYCGWRGLMALAMWRGDEEAREILHRSIDDWKRWFVDPGYSWAAFRDHYELEGHPGTGAEETPWPEADAGWSRRVVYEGKSLLEYYLETGYEPARELGVQLCEHVLEQHLSADGSMDNDHMYLPSMQLSALALCGRITGNREMLERVRLAYEHGMKPVMAPTIGWVPERRLKQSDVGEINNTGEVIEALLNLGAAGWPAYYQDAERFTRAHLLPAQLLDVSWVEPSPENPPDDSRRAVRERVRGAWGFPAPYGIVATREPYFEGAYFMDIVCGGTWSTAAVKAHCVDYRDGVHYVNLLFDRVTPRLAVQSPYPDGDALRVRLAEPGPVHVRLSDWVDRAALHVSGREGPLDFHLDGVYLVIPAPPVDEWITVEFPLAIRESVERVNGREIRIRWKGDSVLAMDSMGTPYPFFPEFAEAGGTD
ncbi:MAG: hypothetical protein BWZ08_02265 [candidate division BRC1 bacterium ADurb.BinA292]|nr:MAG: hypothetical protein BWZ08_02265 [candidate division BRC1 bacterium ADurb.BinA292]